MGRIEKPEADREDSKVFNKSVLRKRNYENADEGPPV